MKKLSAVIIIILGIFVLQSLSYAEDKIGYVVKETFTFNLIPNPKPGSGGIPWGPWDESNQGRVYCAADDFVTGCSYALQRYPGYTDLSDYTFHNVIPIECTPDLRNKDSGKAVCRGCLVTLTVNHPDPPEYAQSPTDGDFSVYVYCGRPRK